MAALSLAVLLVFIQTTTAGSQEPYFETSLISVVRAVSQGEAKKALLFYEKQAGYFENLARSTESTHRWWEEAARAYREASNTAHFLGDLQKAIVYGEKALALTEKLGHRRLKLATLSSLVWAHGSGRNFAKVKELIELAFKVTKELPQNTLDWLWWHGVFHLHRGQDFKRRQEFDKAIEDFEQSIHFKNEFLKTLPGGDRKELARTNMLAAYSGRGDTYLSVGNYDQALDAYQRGLEAAKEWKLEFHQNRFYLGLGDILHRRKDFTGAVDNFHKALELARRQQRPDVISSAARRIGDVLRDTGKTSDAIVFYQQAVQEIESIRSLLVSENTRQAYFGGWLGAYWGLTETLWETGAHEEAFHYGERVRSRAFLDMLGTKVQLTRMKDTDARGLPELNDSEDREESYRAFLDKVRKADPEQASLMTVEPLTLKQVQALLETDQTLLEYLVTAQRIYLWVVDKQQVRPLTIPISHKELVSQVHGLRTAISDLRPLKEYQAIARDLYQQFSRACKILYQRQRANNRSP